MTASQSACANTGIDPNLYGTDLKSPADQYNILQGGSTEAALECAGYWGTYCGKNPQPKWSGNYKATLFTPYDVCVRQSGGKRLRKDVLNKSCLGQEREAGSQSRPFFV